MYYGQFYSHLTYGCQLWGQNENKPYLFCTLSRTCQSSPQKPQPVETYRHRQNNIISTHDTINAKTPPIFESHFNFDKTSHQNETVNSLNSTYSLPTGSLKLPAYITESGKSSIRFICSSAWNSMLKDFFIKNNTKYNKDPFWSSKTNIKILKHILHKHFLE